MLRAVKGGMRGANVRLDALARVREQGQGRTSCDDVVEVTGNRVAIAIVSQAHAKFVHPYGSDADVRGLQCDTREGSLRGLGRATSWGLASRFTDAATAGGGNDGCGRLRLQRRCGRPRLQRGRGRVGAGLGQEVLKSSNSMGSNVAPSADRT